MHSDLWPLSCWKQFAQLHEHGRKSFHLKIGRHLNSPKLNATAWPQYIVEAHVTASIDFEENSWFGLPHPQWVHWGQNGLRSSCGSASGGPFCGRSHRREVSAGGPPVTVGCSWRAGQRRTADLPAGTVGNTGSVLMDSTQRTLETTNGPSGQLDAAR